MPTNIKNQTYSKDNITTLSGLEHIRAKTGMYLPHDLHARLHHLLWEVVDNSIDEMTSGFATKVTITLNEDNSVIVEDNGRGIPNGAIVDSLTKVNTSGKFEDGSYQYSVGTHGIGIKATNAFSDQLIATVKRNNKIYQVICKHFGNVVQPEKVIGKTTNHETGTQITFWPDHKTFHDIHFDINLIKERLFKLQFLIPKYHVKLIDKKTNQEFDFKQKENGLKDYILYLTKNYTKLQTVIFNEILQIQDVKPFVSKNQILKNNAPAFIEVALLWTTHDEEINDSFANFVNTIEGGSHVNAVRYKIPIIINKLAREWKILKNKEADLDARDVREGLAIVVNVKLGQDLLSFSGQTKQKLESQSVVNMVNELLDNEFLTFAKKNKKEMTNVINHIIQNRDARIAAKAKSESIKKLKKTDPKIEKTISAKLTKCSGKDFLNNELFLCEGDSASGGLKTGRNHLTQSVLPLRGKVLNAFKATTQEVLNNEELATIIYCIGTGIGTHFDIQKANYGKIIITTDADEDGNHITVLLLTFFYKFMRPLIEAGHVFVSKSPLFLITDKKTKKEEYAFTITERDAIWKKHKNNTSIETKRFKGLGEMNNEQLKKTIIDTQNRHLIKVTIQDAINAEKYFNIISGNDANLRKQWINQTVNFDDLEE